MSALNARLITVAVPAKDLDRSKQFYETLLGQQFGRSLNADYISYYAWASSGVKFTTGAAWGETDTVMLNFAVADLNAAAQAIQAAGGQILHTGIKLTVAPAVLEDFAARYESLGLGVAEDVGGDMGTSAVAQDSEGNRFLITQLAPYAEAFFEEGMVKPQEFRQHRSGLGMGRKLDSSGSGGGKKK